MLRYVVLRYFMSYLVSLFCNISLYSFYVSLYCVVLCHASSYYVTMYSVLLHHVLFWLRHLMQRVIVLCKVRQPIIIICS